MMINICVVKEWLCPLPVDSPKLFGFPDFLTGLALMALAWTIGDVRYRFRIRSAPIPLQGITYIVVAFVGILTLLTDLWRAQGWLVPRIEVITPASWQILLAGVYFLTLLIWIWFAFIRPPRFGKRNTKRYAQTLYRFILKGSQKELAIVADELRSSISALVKYATIKESKYEISPNQEEKKKKKVEAYADDILLLIADKRLCKAIVEYAPGTLLTLFNEIGESEKYGIRIETFAQNIVSESLNNKNSFLYHEVDGYESGLIGYLKPLTQAMFGNYVLVETIGTMLDVDFDIKSNWDVEQFDAYCRICLMVFNNYIEKGYGGHSHTLYRAMSNIKYAVQDVNILNGDVDGNWDNPICARLRQAINFIVKAVKILEEKDAAKGLAMRTLRRNSGNNQNRSVYDNVSDVIFEIIYAASAVYRPRERCWFIQNNLVWSELFNFNKLDGQAGYIVKKKVCRLLYREIAGMKSLPNFKGARILAFCLNVLGLRIKNEEYYKDSRPLQKVVLGFTTKNYAWLRSKNVNVSDHCLVDGFTYDVDNHRIVLTYPAGGLSLEPHYDYLVVDQLYEGVQNITK